MNAGKTFAGQEISMLTFLKGFRKCESGAVSVDFVVLTAAMVGMAIGVIAIVSTAAQDPADGLGANLSELPVGV
jgi:hypothetical protein